MKVLNLYAGIGGNRKLWTGVHVTAVESDETIGMAYHKFFLGDSLVLGDAHSYLEKYYMDFDFIWSSPPCQSHSRMMNATKHKRKRYPDFTLYQEIIFLQNFFKGKWVVENVKPYYEPLIKPTAIIGRHYFWSNFDITYFEMPNHPNFIRADSPQEIKNMKKWLGLNYKGNIYYNGNHSPGQVLRNCVHPETGLHILNCARNIITKNNSKELTFDFNTPI